jgi:hypothetical protein
MSEAGNITRNSATSFALQSRRLQRLQLAKSVHHSSALAIVAQHHSLQYRLLKVKWNNSGSYRRTHQRQTSQDEDPKCFSSDYFSIGKRLFSRKRLCKVSNIFDATHILFRKFGRKYLFQTRIFSDSIGLG